MKSVFVTGIGTGIGKTAISAIICSALKADYWKPVQAGNLEQTDSDTVRALAPKIKIHPERFLLKEPMSPHAAAKREGVAIRLEDFKLPETQAPLVVEGAGGLLVPLNSEHTVIDLIERLKTPVILVSQNYLGSINHTLLSLEALRIRRIPILGLVFNGPEAPDSQSILLEKSGLPMLLRVQPELQLNPEIIERYAGLFSLKDLA